MKLGNQKFENGEEALAILAQVEAYHIFHEYKNDRQMGICMSSIGSLCMQMNDFEKAAVAFSKALDLGD